MLKSDAPLHPTFVRPNSEILLLELSQPCCRKCRRELIIELIIESILQTIQSYLTTPDFATWIPINGIARLRVPHERLQNMIGQMTTQLDEMEKQCSNHYRHIWATWTSENRISTRPATLESEGNETSDLGPNYFRGLLSVFNFQKKRRSKVKTSLWTSIVCPHCGVWINSNTVCRCSGNRECFPCSLSRLKSSLKHIPVCNEKYASDGDSFSPPSTPLQGLSMRRRAFSLPTNLSRCQSLTESLSGKLRRLFVLDSEDYHIRQSSVGNIPPLFKEDILDPPLFKEDILNPPLFNDAIDALTLRQFNSILESIIPNHIRFLPSTHYTTFFHGLYGNAQDYSRFRNRMLKVYPDLHCFIPDCYSHLSMAGVEFLTSICREYLFLYRPSNWGAGRIPVTPDLIRHLLDEDDPCIIPRSINGELIHSKIFLSFVGHSLGGLIARSIVLLNDFVIPVPTRPLLYQIPPYNGQLCPVIQKRRRSTLASEIETLNHSTSTNIVFVNFITFASPHNGIYEASGGLRAVCSLVPTGRDVMTSSIELQRLASPSSILALSRFSVLALYGNVSNDYLVGPFTSLVINPLQGNRFSADNTQYHYHYRFPKIDLHFPNCVKLKCIKNPMIPVELSSSGFLLSKSSERRSTIDCRSCDDWSCVHNILTRCLPIRTRKIRRWGRNNTNVSFFEQLREEAQNIQSFLKASFPLGSDQISKTTLIDSDSQEVHCSITAIDLNQYTDDLDETDSDIFTEEPIDISSESKPQATEINLKPPSIQATETYIIHPFSLPPQSIDDPPFRSSLMTTPFSNVRYFGHLPWRRFAVHLPTTFRAHACIIWHERMDSWNLGEQVVHQFSTEVFVHPFHASIQCQSSC